MQLPQRRVKRVMVNEVRLAGHRADHLAVLATYRFDGAGPEAENS
jgi:hypothetical protein